MSRVFRRKSVDNRNHWVAFILEQGGGARTDFVEFNALRRYKTAAESYEDAFDKASDLIARAAMAMLEGGDVDRRSHSH